MNAINRNAVGQRRKIGLVGKSPKPNKPRKSLFSRLSPMSAWIVAVITLTLLLFSHFRAESGCTIKGNIAEGTGERIYHMPDQEYYKDTRIRYFSGERWFCTEVEAIAAGWRKSKI